MKGKVMQAPRFVLFALVPFTMAVNAETILWHHFDERSPGETAQTTDVFVNSASSDYSSGAAYSIDTGTSLGSDPDFMPTFAPPCYREAIYDPVSGEVYTNTASISFRTEGTSSAVSSTSRRSRAGTARISSPPAAVRADSRRSGRLAAARA